MQCASQEPSLTFVSLAFAKPQASRELRLKSLFDCACTTDYIPVRGQLHYSSFLFGQCSARPSYTSGYSTYAAPEARTIKSEARCTPIQTAFIITKVIFSLLHLDRIARVSLVSVSHTESTEWATHLPIPSDDIIAQNAHATHRVLAFVSAQALLLIDE